MQEALVPLALGLLGPEHLQGTPDRATASAKPDGPIWSAGGDGNGNGTGMPIVNGNMDAFDTGSNNVGAFNGNYNSGSSNGNSSVGGGNGNLNVSSGSGNGNIGAGKVNLNGNPSLSLFRR